MLQNWKQNNLDIEIITSYRGFLNIYTVVVYVCVGVYIRTHT